MPRHVRAVVWLVVCLASPLAAQSEGPTAGSASDTADALVLDHDFIAGVGEFVRVFLQAKQVYRAELSTPDVTLGIRSPLRRVQLPRVYPLVDSYTPSGSSVVEIGAEIPNPWPVRAGSVELGDGRTLPTGRWEHRAHVRRAGHAGAGDLRRTPHPD